MRGGVAFLLAFPSLHVSLDWRHARVRVFFLPFCPAEVRASSLSKDSFTPTIRVRERMLCSSRVSDLHRICQNSYVLLVLINYESGWLIEWQSFAISDKLIINLWFIFLLWQQAVPGSLIWASFLKGNIFCASCVAYCLDVRWKPSYDCDVITEKQIEAWRILILKGVMQRFCSLTFSFWFAPGILLNISLCITQSRLSFLCIPWN